MNIRERLAPRYVWVDGLVTIGVLAVANLLVAPSDPGWLQLNPSPYLLVPLLLGGRYGFGPGIVAGFVVAAGVSIVRLLLGFSSDLVSELQSHSYTWIFTVVIGGVAGELWLYYRRRVEQLQASEEVLRGKLRQLDADAMILREAKDELDRVTAARDGEISSLDAELRRLYACSAVELPEAILSLLKRQVRVTDAALYRVAEDWAEEGVKLERFGLMGSDERLPPELVAMDQDMVSRALQVGSLVTLPEIMDDSRPDDDIFLMTAPLVGLDGTPRALLVVAEMPFIAFNPAAADLIDLVCGWSGGVLELSEGAEGRYRIVAEREGQRIFFEDHFRHLVTLAFESCRRHRLPSAVVELALPGQPISRQAEFEQIVLGAVRSGDFVSHPGGEFPALQVLLPLAGERGTDIFIDRCSQFCLRQGVELDALEVRRVDLGAFESVETALAQLSGKERTGDA